MGVEEWLLTPAGRDNPATRVDRRHRDGRAFTAGNDVRPLVHGGSYFPELLRCVRQQRAGDLLVFTDWRGDPDERLLGAGTEISAVFAEAASRGVIVKGLIWRSHLDRLAFSEQQNRHLGEEIEAHGGECLLDMRVRAGGSHHQKFVVLRHPGRPELDVAFVGGIDLCHSRNDTAAHHGDPQPQPIAPVYGPTPAWHDIQLAVRGPAVGDLETVFRERWEDPQPLTRNPVDRLSELARRDDHRAGPLPEQLPDPAPRGTSLVQVLRTYPRLGLGRAYPFAPNGERSVARAYTRVLERAHGLVYVEDQYFWSSEVVGCFARALAADPQLRLIVVIPHHPDQSGRLALPMNLVGRQDALDDVRAAGGDRVAVYGVENHAGTPVYVHAKVCVVDDVWASVGSDNINRRSWTHDSELSCAVIDEEFDDREPRVVDRFDHGARRFARDLRLQLAREHLDRAPDDDGDLVGPVDAFRAFAESAARLQAWYDAGRRGDRPPGRLRPYVLPRLSRATRSWARPLYRALADPDGRPRGLRHGDRF
ncbi:MAG TPA: phospholipase D family protein [Jatrophihabitans sp.]|jgi:phosphatidylserine/phosphatidylglycerophosphate/cardiolipin synthase-like enzyme|uniref:phospholipase D family protein n=1 Tax=Jatrophihabitans sp. TaxID=1932789 RepID=UPI002DF8E7AE|nr:phospholipase D family protein [Jatrophihabitans sp.]